MSISLNLNNRPFQSDVPLVRIDPSKAKPRDTVTKPNVRTSDPFDALVHELKSLWYDLQLI